MQDPTTFPQIKPQFPEQEHLKCPRCDSANTKFCYYNNYNLSQPRHFCKNCRRYWTRGGTLRNIPIGGASRKNTKRAKPNQTKPSVTSQSFEVGSSMTSFSSSQELPKLQSYGVSVSSFDQVRKMGGVNGGLSFSSFFGSDGQFGNLSMEGLHPNGSMMKFGELVEKANSGAGSGASRNVDPPLDASSCWRGGNGWPDLAIHTPGSSFFSK